MPRMRRAEALSLIFGLGDPRGVECRTFLDRAEAQGLDLDNLWGVFEAGDAPGRRASRAGATETGADGKLLAACLALVGSGRTAMFFAGGEKSPAEPGNARGKGDKPGFEGPGELALRVVIATTREQVIRAGSEAIWKRGVGGVAGVRGVRGEGIEPVVLAQTLVEPRDTAVQVAFERAGFRRIAELAYLRRPLLGAARAGAERGNPPDGREHLRTKESHLGVKVVSLAEIGERDGRRLLGEALETSYLETADCPELCGLRSTDDVIDSHRGVGEFDPNLWWIVVREGRGVGCALFSRCPDIASVELVYLGVGPEVRGKGLAGALLRLGIDRLTGGARRGARASGDATLTCAVDVRNAAALRLYSAAGMRECARRVALVWARAWESPARGA